MDILRKKININEIIGQNAFTYFSKALLLVLLFLFLPITSFAASNFVSAVPAVIDEKVRVRDIIKDTITITNTSVRKLDIYASVHNIDKQEGEKEFLSRTDVELGESLANWIEVTRGVIELSPGESRDIDVVIHINLNAAPGDYYANISFSTGGSRKRAEELAHLGESVAVNIEVTEDVKERLQLGTFISDKLFFSGPQVSFLYELENVGNKDLNPQGEIRIYNRRGEEVGAVEANSGNTVISPDDTGQLASAWTASSKFGRYKALLDVEYGVKNTATVNDTIYFWIIPWKSLLALFLTLATLVGISTYMVYQRYETRLKPARVRDAYAPFEVDDPDHIHIDEQYYEESTTSTPPTENHLLDMRD